VGLREKTGICLNRQFGFVCARGRYPRNPIVHQNQNRAQSCTMGSFRNIGKIPLRTIPVHPENSEILHNLAQRTLFHCDPSGDVPQPLFSRNGFGQWFERLTGISSTPPGIMILWLSCPYPEDKNRISSGVELHLHRAQKSNLLHNSAQWVRFAKALTPTDCALCKLPKTCTILHNGQFA
jgi:hypothetical protein